MMRILLVSLFVSHVSHGARHAARKAADQDESAVANITANTTEKPTLGELRERMEIAQQQAREARNMAEMMNATANEAREKANHAWHIAEDLWISATRAANLVSDFFLRPCFIKNAHSSRRLYAKDGNYRTGEMWVGAQAGTNELDAEKWYLDKVEFGEGAYTIRNAHSQRRLFAQTGKNGEHGFGAVRGTVSVYADQYWFIEDAGSGTYKIRNYFSGRCVYAKTGETGEDGVGAGQNCTHDDDQWIFESA